MKKYHFVPISGQETHCYNLPEDNFSPRLQPEPAWNGVTLIDVDNCPLKKDCVAIDDNNVTRVCDYLVSYGFQLEKEPDFEHLQCKYGHKVTNRKVVRVTVFDCPVDRESCIDEKGRCKHIEILIPLDASRPHYCVGCALLEG